MSDSLWPHGLQHARLPCPSPTSGACSNSCPSSLILCHLLLLLPSVFPSIRVFSKVSVLHIRWPKYWSFSFSISPFNEYSWLISLGWTDWISLQSKWLLRVFSNTTVQSINSSPFNFFYSPTLTSIHEYWKNHSLDYTDLCWQSNVSAFEYAI